MPNCPTCRGTGQVTENLLVILRRRKGADQTEVAEAVGMSQSSYSRVEKLWPRIPWSRRQRLADYFEITIEQLEGRAPLTTPAKLTRPARRPPAKSIAASKRRRAAMTKKNRR